FVGVQPGQYRVEAEPCPEWEGAVSPAFTVHTGTVTVDPLGQPLSAEDAADGAAPTEAGAPPAEGPAAVEASTAVTDLVWMLLGGGTLLGGVTLQAFRSRRARRSAPEGADATFRRADETLATGRSDAGAIPTASRR